MDALTETMRTTCLSGGPGEPEQLLFNPQADSGLAEMALDDIPRYLFRVVSPRSDGETNATWVRSASASQNTDSSLEDIFFNLNSGKRTTIARALNLHLRWWPKNGLEDNFVSWTSSLLFAIQYIYYRHLSSKDGSNVEEIKLYVIDTTLFPRGTFIRDLDLIEAFWKFDDHPEGKNLKNLRALRNDPRYYFGEYISQGSLKIAYKHRTISGKSLFDRDLLQRLQPEFSNIQSTPSKKPDWVKEVLRLRGDIWTVTKETLSSAKMLDRLKAVGEIVSNFQPGWGFPLAIYFAALIGSESATEDQGKANDNVIFGYFRSEQFNEERKGFDLANFNVVAPDTMPELKRVRELVREIHKDSQLRQALALVEAAEINIRDLHIQNCFSDSESSFLVADSNEVLARAGQTILSRLRMTQSLCGNVILAISPNET